MTSLLALWLPTLVSAVFVFIASSIIHMALGFWHKTDFNPVPDEDKAMDAMRPFGLPPGDYCMPKPSSMKDVSSPAFEAKMDKGPVMFFTMLPKGQMNMGKLLGMWFVYLIVVSGFAGYIAARALPPGANYLSVFRFVGAAAFMCYTMALWQATIWYSKSLVTTLKASIDGLIFALLTAGTFGWLWPH